MKRITLLIPFLALSAFGGYYRHWDATLRARLEREASDPLSIYSHRDGHADAERDLAQGRRRLFIVGETPAWQKEYTGLLNRIYRVETETLPTGPAALSVARYATDYNAVVRRELNGVLGPEALRETEAMAERLHTLNVRIARYVPPL